MFKGGTGTRSFIGLIILIAFMTLGTNGTESCVTTPPPAGQSGAVYGSSPPPSSGPAYGYPAPPPPPNTSGTGGYYPPQPPPQAVSAFYRLKNRWKPDQAINVEQGYVQAAPIQPGWWSAMWMQEPVGW